MGVSITAWKHTPRRQRGWRADRALAALAALCGALIGCASTQSPAVPGRTAPASHHFGVITHAEIVADDLENVSLAEAIRRVDPGMLQDHGVTGLTTGVVVFYYGVQVGVGMLNEYPAGEISRVEYLSAAAATLQFGALSAGHAALLIQTRHQ